MKAFIDEHRDAHGVEPICKVLPIAPSTYYAHAARQADPAKRTARARSDAALMVAIRRVFEENFGVYGVRKIWRQFGREGIRVARCTVARLMRVLGLQGVMRGRKARTTMPDPSAACPLDGSVHGGGGDLESEAAGGAPPLAEPAVPLGGHRALR